jgi:dTDP-4-dehydrorhamnose reductase
LRILITGAAGQVGRALRTTAPAGVQVVPVDRSSLDIVDALALATVLDEAAPQIVINAAASTAVDRAESEPECAMAVNGKAIAQLAQACSQRRIKLIHVSTDYVFDGGDSTPYRTDAPTGPLNVYGASKLCGEAANLAEPGLVYWIVRSSWIYEDVGRNFVLTMLRLFTERSRIDVVANQIGTPTSAYSLAECPGGVAHFTDAGMASWYDVAAAIYEEARQLQTLTRDLSPRPRAIATGDYPTAVRCPVYSVLDKTQGLARLCHPPCHWRVALRKVLLRIEQ